MTSKLPNKHDEFTVKTRDGVAFGKDLCERDFLFEKGWRNLNHGSFGTFPRPVRDTMRAFQDQCEARPDSFMTYTYYRLLDESREALAKYLNAPASTLVLVPNASTGINTVLRNLVFEPGDHILTFSTIYGACDKTVSYITETTPASSVKVEYTYPVEDDWLVDQLKAKAKKVEAKGGKVKMAIFDTIVSQPGVRMPFERLTAVCKELGILSCIDGAHGIGHIPLDLGTLDPDFFVSNCHKWLHVPRGCAIFHIPLRNQHLIRSTIPTSHGFEPRMPGIESPFPPPETTSSNTPFTNNFAFIGTIDNSPYLCIPAALAYRESLGGEEIIMQYNQQLAQTAGRYISHHLGTEVLENSTGTLGQCCMSNIRLPISVDTVMGTAKQHGIHEQDVAGVKVRDWFQRVTVDEYKTFLKANWYAGCWWVRVSGQVYLDMGDFEWMAGVLGELCKRVEKGEWVGKRV